MQDKIKIKKLSQNRKKMRTDPFPHFFFIQCQKSKGEGGN